MRPPTRTLSCFVLCCLLQLVVSSDPAPTIFLHYLPWYTGNAGGGRPRRGWCDARLSDQECATGQSKQYIGGGPYVGEYDQRQSAVLEYHSLLAAAAGVDVILVNVNPTSAFHLEVCHLLIDVLAELHELHALNLSLALSYDNSAAETQPLIEADMPVVAALLARAEQYGVSHVDPASGAPAVFVWSEHAAADVWSAMRDALPPNTTLLARNAVDFKPSDGNFFWLKPMRNGSSDDEREDAPDAYWGRFYLLDSEWIAANGQADLLPHERNSLIVGAAYPGFNDAAVPIYWNGGVPRLIPRVTSSGETYALTWEHTLSFSSRMSGSAQPLSMPWVQIITWNDWPEGTAIEPAVDDASAYAATREYARRWHAQHHLGGGESGGGSGDEDPMVAVEAAAAILRARQAGVISNHTLIEARQLLLSGRYADANATATVPDAAPSLAQPPVPPTPLPTQPPTQPLPPPAMVPSPEPAVRPRVDLAGFECSHVSAAPRWRRCQRTGEAPQTRCDAAIPKPHGFCTSTEA